MKTRLIRIILSALIWIVAALIGPDQKWIYLSLFLVSYAIVGWNIIWKAIRNITRGNVFDENFLMGIAAIGAFIIKEYPEGVAVMLFYQIGELFQDYAVDKSRRSITELMDIRPEFANVKIDDNLILMDPDEVRPGDIIMIKAGERVPLDGIILEGQSFLDTSALTGEYVPREVQAGNELLSGCINLNTVLTVEVTKEYGESTVSRILDLVENASSKKSTSERFITRFARYYTPVVVIIAVFLAFLPPLHIDGATFSDWFYRSLSFLVVSCPCALVISVPLSFFGGIGGASSKGILVKGGNYLEILAQADRIVFDKTGTLTKGVFRVQEIQPVQTGDSSQKFTKEELLELAALAEHFSNHPISLSLRQAYGQEIDSSRITDMEEITGHGVRAVVDDKEILAGNYKLMDLSSISYPSGEWIGTVVHVAVNGEYAGFIEIADEIKEDSTKAIRDLKKAGIEQTIMLTGDNEITARKVSEELGLDNYYAKLLPEDKVEKLEDLLSQSSPKTKLAYVGDGINDAPVLARADVGIAMGGLGSDAAIEAADVVIMTDEPSKIVTAIRIAKKTLGIAWQNIYLAIAVKIAVLILSALGITTLWAAIFADVGVTVVAVLNSLRAMNVKGL
ncbi:MAG TPA: cadmium-translocating P-type ATPase [Clostridiales bacterium]|nr:heavy metal translocating P-type ATPase [Clostridia bacterium]HCS72889.1 cadmium-translocating P-type ATPase [Clostridiales bacterium]